MSVQLIRSMFQLSASHHNTVHSTSLSPTLAHRTVDESVQGDNVGLDAPTDDPVTPSGGCSLLLVGAYRDNEVGEGHPLQLLIRELRDIDKLRTSDSSSHAAAACVSSTPPSASSGPRDAVDKLGMAPGAPTSRLHEISIGPLLVEDVAALLLDSFRCSESAAYELGRLLVRKCHGNPFFIVQALTKFHHDKLITFGPVPLAMVSPRSKSASGATAAVRTPTEPSLASSLDDLSASHWQWTWEIEQLSAADIGDNVVDLLIRNIGMLKPRLQEWLKLAACLGHRFTLHFLSVTSATPIHELSGDVWTLVELGLLVPTGPAHAFATLAADGALQMASPAPPASSGPFAGCGTVSPAGGNTMREEDDVALRTSETHLFNNRAAPQKMEITASLEMAHCAKELELRFSHDGVQAAAYSLLSPSERPKMHSKVARLLLATTTPAELDSVLMDIVEHFDTAGLAAVASEQELRTVIALNLRAGQKAKSNTAWQPANKYLSFAVHALKYYRASSDATEVALRALRPHDRSDTSSLCSGAAIANVPQDLYQQIGVLNSLPARSSGTRANITQAPASADDWNEKDELSSMSEEDQIHCLDDAATYAMDHPSSASLAANLNTAEAYEEACWRREYQLCLQLHRELIEVALLLAEFERAEQLVAVCLKYTIEDGRNIMDQISIHELLMASQAVYSNQMTAAVETGLYIVGLLGVDLVSLTPDLCDQIERDAAGLVDRPLKDNLDERELCVARVLTLLAPNCYLVANSRPSLVGDVCATIYLHTLKHGGSGLVGIGLGVLSVLLWHQGILKAELHPLAAVARIEAAVAIGKFSIVLDERYVYAEPHRSSKPWQGRAINCFQSSLNHYKEHLRQTIAPLQRAIRLCSTRGDHQFASYASYFTFTAMLHSGYSLEVVATKLQAFIQQMDAQRLQMIVSYLSVARCLVLQLISEDDEWEQAENGAHPASMQTMEGHMEKLRAFQSTMNVCSGYNDLALSAFYRYDYARCVARMEESLPFLPGSPGTMNWPEVHFFGALARMQCCVDVARAPLANTTPAAEVSPTSQGSSVVLEPLPKVLFSLEQQAQWESEFASISSSSLPSVEKNRKNGFQQVMVEVDRSIAYMSTWASLAEMNYGHKLALLKAEQMHCYIMRTDGRRRWEYVLPAMHLYDDAIAGARNHLFVQDELLANELAAQFCSSVGRFREVSHYVRAAYACAVRWGSALRQRQLKRRYPVLFSVGGSTHAPIAPLPVSRTGELRSRRLDRGGMPYEAIGTTYNEMTAQRAMPSPAHLNSRSASYSSSVPPAAVVSGVELHSELADRHLESAAESASIQDSVSAASTKTRTTTASGSVHSGRSIDVNSVPSNPSTSQMNATPPLSTPTHDRSSGISHPYHALDLASVMRASQAFSVETRFDVLLEQLMSIVLQHSAASRGVLVLESGGQWIVEIQSTIDKMYLQAKHALMSSAASSEAAAHTKLATTVQEVMPLSIFSYVVNTRKAVLLSAAEFSDGADNIFARDAFFAKSLVDADSPGPVSTCSPEERTPPSTASYAARSSQAQPVGKPKSVLCLPIVKGGQLIGLVYLENMYHDVSVSFTTQHMQVLRLLLSQAALSIENARFTRQLQQQNAALLAEVHQRQQAEEDMRTAKDAAEAAAQSKAAFLSNMSHEVRMRPFFFYQVNSLPTLR
jgi:predicted ATPase/GAF domain-containing protein